MENRELAAHCGLFCASCSVYIATQRDEDALESIAKKFGTTKDEVRCDGCRSGRIAAHCRNCSFRSCVQGKGLDNCEDCSDFPCPSLREFQPKMPHRAELFESARYRKSQGLERWFLKMHDDFACSCGTVNSPYYLRCRQCGKMPGNAFIGRNLDSIRKYLNIGPGGKGES